MPRSLLLFVCLVAGCATQSTSTSGPREGQHGKIVKDSSCPEGEKTYIGFRGKGEPPPALLDEVKKRFTEARVIEVGDGKLGVVIGEPYSMDARGRHEAAAAAVGWTGDVVDFASVKADCSATFHTPLPPP